MCNAGQVLVRDAPANVPKNGKKFFIHTFGCQASREKRPLARMPPLRRSKGPLPRSCSWEGVLVLA